jgi:membrane-bound lytic murein transglycosylase D
VQRTGYADFWELRSRNVLPLETANYVPVILAMTLISKNLKEYGIEEVDADPPLEYESIQLPSNTNLELLAAAVERPVSELRDLNPALLKNIAPAGYDIHLPKGTAAAALAALELVPRDKRETWRIHRAQAGDTLAALARRYGTAPAALAAANGTRVSEPEPGEWVVIPYTPKPAAAPRKPAAKKTVASARPRKAPTTAANASKKPAAAAASKAPPYKTASVQTKKSAIAR